MSNYQGKETGLLCKALVKRDGRLELLERHTRLQKDSQNCNNKLKYKVHDSCEINVLNQI